MSRTKELITGALRGIAGKSRALSPLAETAGQARRRLTGVFVSAAAVAAAIVVTVVLLPASAAGSRPAPASIPLRSPLQLRQIAGVTTAPCPPGSVASPVPGELCFNLTRTGMTVTAVQSAYVRKQVIHAPKGKPAVPSTVFWVTLRLTPSGAAQLLALTRDIYRLPKPRNELADIVRGRFTGYNIVYRPDTLGVFSVLLLSRAAAESLLAQLLHG